MREIGDRSMTSMAKRRRHLDDESDGDCCSSSGSDTDKKVGMTQRDRVCQELRDLQVIFFYFVCIILFELYLFLIFTCRVICFF